MNRLFIEKHATKWRGIGLELNITSEALDIIKVDYPTEVQARCRAMLKAWLQKDPEASWEQLLHAAETTDKQCHIASIKMGKILAACLYKYKPRLVGVFNNYTTQVRRQRKFATDKPWAQRARDLSVANFR